MFKKPVLACCVPLLLLAGCGSGGSDDTSNASEPDPQDDVVPTPPPVTSALSQSDARVGACVNMGNHLEAPNEGDWGRPINETDFADIASRGFETVRLPVRFSNHANTLPPFTLNSAFMQRVVDVVDMAIEANLRVIIDLHHYDDPQGSIFANPDGEAQRFAEIWRQIGAQFAAYDTDAVWFELLNEPHDNLNHQNLLSILTPALNAVRSTNPTRPVVIGGETFSSIRSLESLPLPNDAYIIATFHYYDPFPFTHQGAPFITPRLPLGVEFTEADREQLQRDVETAQEFMARTEVPVFLGEFGVFDSISVEQRAEYYEAVSTSFGEIDIDGCGWGYTNTFPFRDPVTAIWTEELLSAIGL